MKSLKLLVLFLIYATISNAQVYNQTNIFGTGGIGLQNSRAIDSQGNYYTVGFHQGPFTYGSTSADFAGGNQDVFLTKTDANGDAVWVKAFTGLKDNAALDVTTDTNNNIYLTGFFQGSGSNSFDADPSAFTYPLSQVAMIASRDTFVIKLDSNGDFVWAKQFSNQYGAVNEDGKGIRVDSNGNVFILGDFMVADFDPSSTNQFILCANNDGTTITTEIDCVSNSSIGNSTDTYIVKLDTNGDLIWAKQLRSLGASSSKAIARAMDMDTNGNIYLSGRFNEQIDLDPSTTTDALFNTNGDYDAFLVKLDNNGDYVWGSTFGSATADEPSRLYYINNKIYITGYVSGTTDFDPSAGTNSISINGLSAGFVSTFDANTGAYESTYTVDGNDTTGVAEKIFSVSIYDDKMYIAGTFEGTADFDVATTGTVTSTSNGAADTFLTIIDNTTGAYQEHFIVGGTDSEPYAWADINNGMVFYSGNFRSATVDFNPFSGTDTQNLVSTTSCFISTFTPNTLTLRNDDFRVNDNILLYPNPVTNQINFSNSNEINNFEIYSIDGKLIKANTVNSNSIDVSDLAKGTYIIQVKGENFIHSKKFIKE